MGKGSSKGHTPREAKDNLKSTQLLSVIDAISEGPIEGPVGAFPGMPNQALTMSPALATAIFWLTSIPESEVAGLCR
ncbi:host specificity protein J [Escherichia coli]